MPERLLATGWDGLVAVLDAGGYARYDFKTASKLLDVMQNLLQQYAGDVRAVHARAKDAHDLETRLKALGKGIGETTVHIFLRELRGIWPKADPPVSPLAWLAAEHLGLLDQSERSRDTPLQIMQRIWKTAGMRTKTFADFESALVRVGRDYCRRNRLAHCPMKEFCEGRPVPVSVPVRRSP